MKVVIVPRYDDHTFNLILDAALTSQERCHELEEIVEMFCLDAQETEVRE